MDKLSTFVREWNASGDIAALLEKGIQLPDAKEVQAHLATLPKAEQDVILTALGQAMTALEAHAANLEAEAAKIKTQIDQNLKTARACLSYSAAETAGRK